MMDASNGVKGLFDYIPEPYSKFVTVQTEEESEFQKRTSIKAKHSDMMFLFMVLMLLY